MPIGIVYTDGFWDPWEGKLLFFEYTSVVGLFYRGLQNDLEKIMQKQTLCNDILQPPVK